MCILKLQHPNSTHSHFPICFCTKDMYIPTICFAKEDKTWFQITDVLWIHQLNVWNITALVWFEHILFKYFVKGIGHKFSNLFPSPYITIDLNSAISNQLYILLSIQLAKCKHVFLCSGKQIFALSITSI